MTCSGCACQTRETARRRSRPGLGRRHDPWTLVARAEVGVFAVRPKFPTRTVNSLNTQAKHLASASSLLTLSLPLTCAARSTVMREAEG